MDGCVRRIGYGVDCLSVIQSGPVGGRMSVVVGVRSWFGPSEVKRRHRLSASPACCKRGAYWFTGSIREVPGCRIVYRAALNLNTRARLGLVVVCS